MLSLLKRVFLSTGLVLTNAQGYFDGPPQFAYFQGSSWINALLQTVNNIPLFVNELKMHKNSFGKNPILKSLIELFEAVEHNKTASYTFTKELSVFHASLREWDEKKHREENDVERFAEIIFCPLQKITLKNNLPIHTKPPIWASEESGQESKSCLTPEYIYRLFGTSYTTLQDLPNSKIKKGEFKRANLWYYTSNTETDWLLNAAPGHETSLGDSKNLVLAGSMPPYLCLVHKKTPAQKLLHEKSFTVPMTFDSSKTMNIKSQKQEMGNYELISMIVAEQQPAQTSSHYATFIKNQYEPKPRWYLADDKRQVYAPLKNAETFLSSWPKAGEGGTTLTPVFLVYKKTN